MTDEFTNAVEDKVSEKLELDKCKRIIQRLDSFSSDCDECKQHFLDFEKHMTQLMDKQDDLTKKDAKHHTQKINHISSHLHKKHKLVTSGYYLGVFLSLGISLGVVFGLLIFDNMALGIPVGLGIGIAVGIGFDEDAKKKGLTL